MHEGRRNQMKEKVNVTDYANLITKALPKGIYVGEIVNAYIIK